MTRKNQLFQFKAFKKDKAEKGEQKKIKDMTATHIENIALVISLNEKIGPMVEKRKEAIRQELKAPKLTVKDKRDQFSSRSASQPRLVSPKRIRHDGEKSPQIAEPMAPVFIPPLNTKSISAPQMTPSSEQSLERPPALKRVSIFLPTLSIGDRKDAVETTSAQHLEGSASSRSSRRHYRQSATLFLLPESPKESKSEKAPDDDATLGC